MICSFETLVIIYVHRVVYNFVSCGIILNAGDFNVC
jgi:hypothetical protein